MRFVFRGHEYETGDGVPKKVGARRTDQGERGVTWVSLSDAVRITGFGRSSLELAIDHGLIRSTRLSDHGGPFPTIFVCYEDAMAWAKYHRPNRRSKAAQPHALPSKTPDHIVKKLKREFRK